MEIINRLKLNQIIGKEKLLKRLIKQFEQELKDLKEERDEILFREDE